MGARGAPCAFTYYKAQAFKRIARRKTLAAVYTLVQVAGKLRKSKNGAAAPAGTYARLPIESFFVCVGVDFVIVAKEFADVL